jgi:putative ABC transport system permease protein
VLKDGVRTTALGLVIGLLLALGLGRLASGMLYRVSPFDPVSVGLAVVTLAGTALLAGYLPARRATRIAPLDALRTE